MGSNEVVLMVLMKCRWPQVAHEGSLGLGLSLAPGQASVNISKLRTLTSKRHFSSQSVSELSETKLFNLHYLSYNFKANVSKLRFLSYSS